MSAQSGCLPTSTEHSVMADVDLAHAASGMRKQLYKPAPEPAASEGEEAAEGKPKEEVKGGGALMIVKDQGNTWQRLTEKLRDAPIIQVRWGETAAAVAAIGP